MANVISHAFCQLHPWQKCWRGGGKKGRRETWLMSYHKTYICHAFYQLHPGQKWWRGGGKEGGGRHGKCFKFYNCHAICQLDPWQKWWRGGGMKGGEGNTCLMSYNCRCLASFTPKGKGRREDHACVMSLTIVMRFAGFTPGKNDLLPLLLSKNKANTYKSRARLTDGLEMT